MRVIQDKNYFGENDSDDSRTLKGSILGNDDTPQEIDSKTMVKL